MDKPQFYELELTEGQLREVFEAMCKHKPFDTDGPSATNCRDVYLKLQVLLKPQWFITRALHYWGRGLTREAALEQLRKSGFRGTTKGKVTLFTLPRGALNPYIDAFGSCRWGLAPGLEPSVQPEVEKL